MNHPVDSCALCGRRREPRAASLLSGSFMCFALERRLLATVSPRDDRPKNYVQSTKTKRHQPIARYHRQEQTERADYHEADAHDWHDAHGKHATGNNAGSVKQQPHAGNRIYGSCPEQHHR